MKIKLLFLIILTLPLTVCFYAAGEENSPWTIWSSGFKSYEKGERLRQNGTPREALSEYKQAREYFLKLQQVRPDWNQKVIGDRITLCNQQIQAIEKELGVAVIGEKPAPVAAEAKSPGSTAEKGSGGGESGKYESELDKYKKKLFDALVELDEYRRRDKAQKDATAEMEKILQENHTLSQKYTVLLEKYNELKEKQSKPEDEIKELQKRLLEEKMQSDALNQRVKMFSDKNEQLEKDMGELKRERTAAKVTDKEREEEMQRLQAGLKILKDQNSEYVRNKETLAEDLGKYKNRENKQKNTIKEREAEIEKLNKMVITLQERPDASELGRQLLEEKKNLSEKVDKLSGDYQKAVQELDSAKQKLREEYMAHTKSKDFLTTLTTERDRLEQQFADLKKLYDEANRASESDRRDAYNLKNKNEELKKELNLFAAKYENTKKEAESCASAEYQAIIAKNNKANQELTDKLTANAASLQAAESRCRTFEAEVEKLRNTVTEYKKLETENANLRQENKLLEQLKKDFSELKKMYHALSLEKRRLEPFEQKVLEQNKAITEQTAKLEAEQKKQSGSLTRAEKIAETVRAELSAAKSANEKLTKDNVALTRLHESQLQELAKKMDGLAKEKVESAQSQLVRLRELETKAAKLEKDNASLAQSHNAKILEMTGKLEGLVKEKSVLEQSQAAKIAKLETKAAQLQADSANIAPLRQEIRKLTEENKAVVALNAECRSLKEMNLKLQNEIKTIEAAKDKQQLQLADSEKLKAELSKITEAKEKLLEEQKTLSAYKLKTERLSDELRKFKADVNAMRKVKNANVELVRELQVLRTDYDKLKSLNDEQGKASAVGKTMAENCSKLESRVKELKSENAALAAVKNENIKLRETLQSAAADQKAIAGLPAIKEKIAAAEKNMQIYRERCSALSEINKKMEADIKKLGKVELDNREFSRQIKNLEDKVKELTRVSEVKKMPPRADEVADKTLAQLAEKDKALANASRELVRCNEEIKKLRVENDKNLAVMESELSAGRKDAAGFRKKAVAMQAVVDAYKNEVADLKNSLAKQTAVLSSVPKIPKEKLDFLLKEGTASEASRNDEAAVWHYNKVIEADPANPDANKRLGILYLRSGQNSKALYYLGQAGKVVPRDPEVLYSLGVALFKQSKTPEAVDFLKRAVALSPNNAAWRAALADVLTAVGRTAEAEAEYRQSYKLVPVSMECCLKLARLLAVAQDKEKRKEAVVFYDKALRLGAKADPLFEKLRLAKEDSKVETVTFLTQSAAEAEQKNDLAAASWYYEQIAALQPELAAFPVKLGIIYLSQGKNDKAVININRALEIAPGNITARLLKAYMEVKAGRAANAAVLYGRALQDIAVDKTYRQPGMVYQLNSKLSAELSVNKAAPVRKAYELLNQVMRQTSPQ